MPNKRSDIHDENDPFAVAFTPDRPPTKKTRRVLPKVNQALLEEQQRRVTERMEQEKLQAEARQAAEDVRACQAAEEQATLLHGSLHHIRERHSTLDSFFDALFQTQDRALSSQVTQLLNKHGAKYASAMHERSPDTMSNWAKGLVADEVAKEGRALAVLLSPDRTQNLTSTLETWKLNGALAAAKEAAPTVLQLLRAAGTRERQGQVRKDRDMIFSVVICLLAQSVSERSNEMQTVMSMYLLACGASQSQFAVLNHAGLTASYATSLNNIRKLRDEQLAKVIQVARSQAFMLVWDNLNFAFRINEQRLGSKDHFDNGTTATLIPLYDVAFGELALTMLKPRTTRLNILSWTPSDLLPSPQCIQQLEEAMLWHIQDILYEHYPELQQRLKDKHMVPTVQAIPVHKTEQYPLPAMSIDESSIDGTLEVMETLVRKVLKFTEDDVRRHGVILCAGDQLTNSLTDKASACRRDDKELLDNPSRYSQPKPGLFHVKMSGTRMVANEHWGKPNSKAPWSLWRMNTLLGRKPISVGWKAKKLPPFRPIHELILKLVLPANIIDAFRTCCAAPSLDTWVKNATLATVEAVSRQVRDSLCSAQRVEDLRNLPNSQWDHTLENIILFNRDALILREFFHTIKRGDIGSVVNILSYWMHEFRGTGSMPKYSDALFEVLMTLKDMKPTLRHAFLMNWLVNLSGQPNRFKEVDLLQEHQNFWMKVVYSSQGSNRRWKWLSMVSVSIFILRDVIRRVQDSFKTPYNGKSHTSPSTEKEILMLREYLETNKVQTYDPCRENSSFAMPTRDLFALGLKHVHTASAFKGFQRVISNVSYKISRSRSMGETEATQADGYSSEQGDEAQDVGENDDVEVEIDMVEMDDVLIDDEEFTPDVDLADTIAGMKAMIQSII